MQVAHRRGGPALRRGTTVARSGGEEDPMPKAWSNKRERQYEHIEESAKRGGRSARRAKEIAARTVNKQRRESGETPQRQEGDPGRGTPDRPLAEHSKQELYDRAKRLEIEGRSQMSKDELVSAIEERT
jgi:hypothetical protein